MARNILNTRRVSLLQKVQAQVERYSFKPRFGEVGEVAAVGDGIAWISGLPSAAMDEMIWFEDGSQGLVFHLGEVTLGAILLEQTGALAAGSRAHLSKQQLSIPVGDALLGRVITPLGAALDDRERPQCERRHLLDTQAPTIYQRDFVDSPLYTGTRIIDALIPVGKGQRQLIVGDEGLGRSSLAVDAVINQKGKGTRCVYVLIGQRRSAVNSVLHDLREKGALEYTTVVVSEAGALAGEKYVAPFAGCAIAEAWMHEGCDVLIIYDDLTTHAHAYRELSLLLRRPPGREAYPGDIFFLHARLLERSTRLAAEFGGGSMTALPIVETQQGEIAAYIPTNLISITDGQIYLDEQLFNSGFRPAIDISKSVSRIGGKGQAPAIKKEAGRTRLDYLQFLELEVFTRLGAKLEPGMERVLKRGRVLRELLKQERLEPVSPVSNLAWLIAFNESWLDELSLAQVAEAVHSLDLFVSRLPLDIESPREQWVAALTSWWQGLAK